MLLHFIHPPKISHFLYYLGVYAEITAVNSTRLCHMFGIEQGFKSDVKNLGKQCCTVSSNFTMTYKSEHLRGKREIVLSNKVSSTFFEICSKFSLQTVELTLPFLTQHPHSVQSGHHIATMAVEMFFTNLVFLGFYRKPEVFV